MPKKPQILCICKKTTKITIKINLKNYFKKKKIGNVQDPAFEAVVSLLMKQFPTAWPKY